MRQRGFIFLPVRHWLEINEAYAVGKLPNIPGGHRWPQRRFGSGDVPKIAADDTHEMPAPEKGTLVMAVAITALPCCRKATTHLCRPGPKRVVAGKWNCRRLQLRDAVEKHVAQVQQAQGLDMAVRKTTLRGRRVVPLLAKMAPGYPEFLRRGRKD